MSKTETLSIDLIRLNGGSQARIKSSEETIEAYAEIIDASNGEWTLGPVDVFHDGSDYFLADGFHRTLAAVRLNRASLPCRIHKGTAKDAKIFGMTANDKHGLRMSQSDKRACVEWLLDFGGKMTQAAISEKAGVNERTVRRIVAERKESDDSKNRTLSGSVSKPLEKSSEITATDSGRDIDELPVDNFTAQSDSPESDSDDVPFDAHEAPDTKPEQPVSRAEQAAKIKNMIQQHIDKAVRLVDDLHAVKRNQPKRMAAVIQLQGVELW